MPVRSPQRPTGSKNMAVASRKEVTSQLNVTASRLKLFSMAGNAIFTDEIRKVPINEVTATIARIEICFLVQFIILFQKVPRQAKITLILFLKFLSMTIISAVHREVKFEPEEINQIIQINICVFIFSF